MAILINVSSHFQFKVTTTSRKNVFERIFLGSNLTHIYCQTFMIKYSE